jgi:hypothetical protein
MLHTLRSQPVGTYFMEAAQVPTRGDGRVSEFTSYHCDYVVLQPRCFERVVVDTSEEAAILAGGMTCGAVYG